MSQYIKTHSNYVLKSKHQTLGDGSTILERDITTIGGLNQFAPGQTPIYRSNNFIITVRNDGGISNQYTTKKWKENDSSGETWTLDSLKDMVSDFDEQNDVKIVLKKDYYDFRDFVYYGSLTEMFRASINDIIARFPGELFGTCDPVYYTTYVTDKDTNDRLEERVRLGGDEDLYEVSNPFGIDLHTLLMPKDADPIKFFADNGFSNYVVYIGDKALPIISWRVIYYERVYNEETGECDGAEPMPQTCYCTINGKGNVGVEGGTVQYTQTTECTSKPSSQVCECTINGEGTIGAGGETVQYTQTTECTTVKKTCKLCVGDKIADIIICVLDKGVEVCYCISAWFGDNYEIVYMSKKSTEDGGCNCNCATKGIACNDIHIRPNDKFIAEFRNGLDNFQKLILNDNTTPKYKATFSVIYGNNYGYYRQFEDFVFPTDSGGYNIDPTAFGFNAYTSRLADIGEFYDEFFTDNLYRSLTHEAIKNFDWTYTREFEQGDEEEYVVGGQKIQKAIRIFAREFDETISYINNIKTINRVTYDERDNLPDYFLTDTVENEGWNVQLIMPFDLTEYFVDENGHKTTINTDYTEVYDGSCNGQIYNQIGDVEFIREFVQSATTEIYPYSAITDDSFFLSCKEESEPLYSCYYNGSIYAPIKKDGFTWYDDSALGEKGALKNRIRSYFSDEVYTYYDVNNEFLKRLKLNSRYIFRHKGTREGIEMILGMFGLRSKEFYERDITFNPCREKHRYSAETFHYEIDEYWAETSPIKDEWDCVHDMYRIDWINSTKTIQYDYRSVSNYNHGASMVDYLPYQGLPVRYEDRDDGRYLYPNFEKYEQYDGNPYFQMNGGWQAKQVVGKTQNNKTPVYNFQFDAEDKVVFNTGNTCADMLYKETVRNVRRFNTLQDMLSVPSNEVYDGQVVYVSNITLNTAVVEGYVYDIKNDARGKYIELVKVGGSVRVGEDVYFNDYVRVYGNSSDATQKSYFLDELPNGYIIKAYIVGDDQFSCSDDYTTIDTIEIMDMASNNCTNYFELTDRYYSNRIYKEGGEIQDGWRRLTLSDKKYKIINTIVNDNKGNNPHNGNMVYDNGTEYFKYYEQLFKYALEEDLFDERCYDDYFSEREEIALCGFTFDNGECGYYKTKNDSTVTEGNLITTTIELNYKINHNALGTVMHEDGNTYYIKGNDVVTNNILNTKFMKITFYLHNDAFSQQGQCEMKYLDDIVMNYLTQMIPSTTILQIKYEKK